eukprot:6197237-Pleurochrysis_carterae.AAC.1
MLAATLDLRTSNEGQHKCWRVAKSVSTDTGMGHSSDKHQIKDGNALFKGRLWGLAHRSRYQPSKCKVRVSTASCWLQTSLHLSRIRCMK